MGDAPALPGRQRQAHCPGRGAGAQVPPPGRSGRRGTDLRLLRCPVAGRRAQRRRAGALVQGTAAHHGRAPAADDARRPDAPRGVQRYRPGLSAQPAPGRGRLPHQLPARTGRCARRRYRRAAAVRAEPGQRRPVRMAGARHAEGKNPGAAEKPAAAPALAFCAAARIGAAALRQAAGHAPQPGPDRRVAA